MVGSRREHDQKRITVKRRRQNQMQRIIGKRLKPVQDLTHRKCHRRYSGRDVANGGEPAEWIYIIHGTEPHRRRKTIVASSDDAAF